MKRLLFIILFIPLIALSQTTYQKTKYKQVWYDATKETGTTWATMDSACVKIGKTSTGNFYISVYDKDGKKVAGIDSTGLYSTYCDTISSATVISIDYPNVLITGTTDIDSISINSKIPNYALIYILLATGADISVKNTGNILLTASSALDKNDILVLQRRDNKFYQISKTLLP
jgi:hypothetical protein